MAYNQDSQEDRTLLNEEVFIDVDGMGYASVPIEKSKDLVAFINDPDNNVGGETATGTLFDHKVLLQTWTPKGAVDESVPWIEALLNERGDISQHESKYRASCGEPSLSNLNAIVLQLSRAEVLFGQGTVLTEEDWYLARDNG